MKKADRNLLAQAKAQIYNQNSQEIHKWVTKYHQALNEIWDQPNKGKEHSLRILEKHGLGTVDSNNRKDKYGGHYTKYTIHWEYNLKQLNKKLKVKL